MKRTLATALLAAGICAGQAPAPVKVAEGSVQGHRPACRAAAGRRLPAAPLSGAEQF
jgi:hypothetical protein